MKGWVNLGAIQWFCGDHVYICEKWHSEVNLRQLARNFEARKILFKNVSRHIRMLVTWTNTIFSKISIWTEKLIANLVASCGKTISGSCNIQIRKADWLEVVIMYIGNFQELKGWSSHLWESHSFRFYYEGVLNKKKLADKFAKTDNYTCSGSGSPRNQKFGLFFMRKCLRSICRVKAISFWF